MSDRELVALMAAIIYTTPSFYADGSSSLAWKPREAVAEAHRLLHIVCTERYDENAAAMEERGL